MQFPRAALFLLDPEVGLDAARPNYRYVKGHGHEIDGFGQSPTG